MPPPPRGLQREASCGQPGVPHSLPPPGHLLPDGSLAGAEAQCSFPRYSEAALARGDLRACLPGSRLEQARKSAGGTRLRSTAASALFLIHLKPPSRFPCFSPPRPPPAPSEVPPWRAGGVVGREQPAALSSCGCLCQALRIPNRLLFSCDRGVPEARNEAALRGRLELKVGRLLRLAFQLSALPAAGRLGKETVAEATRRELGFFLSCSKMSPILR